MQDYEFREIRKRAMNKKMRVISMKEGDFYLEIAYRDNIKFFNVKNNQGKIVFNGPINNPGQKDAVPGEFKKNLEKLEALQKSINFTIKLQLPAPEN